MQGAHQYPAGSPHRLEQQWRCSNALAVVDAGRRPAAVLNNATVKTDNPDLRDRAYIYWRLLSTNPEAAKDVDLAEKHVFSDDSNQLDSSLLDELLANISTISSVYHKPHLSAVLRQLLGQMMRSLLMLEKHGIRSHHFRELMEHHFPLVLASSNVPVKQSAAPALIPDLLGDLMGL